MAAWLQPEDLESALLPLFLMEAHGQIGSGKGAGLSFGEAQLQEMFAP